MLIPILINLVLGSLLSLFLPWWIFIPLSAATAWIFQLSAGRTFLMGFISFALLWLITYLWFGIGNNFILGTRVGQMFGMPSAYLFILLGSLFSGILGGLGAYLGYTIGASKKG